jgi:hypothetical protein
MGRKVGRGWTAIGAAALLAATAAGCKDSGLPGRNTQLAVADTAGWTYPAYDMGTTHPVRVWEHDWMVAAPAIRIPDDRLVEVAKDGDREVFALVTDREPYSRLYLKEQGTYGPVYAPLERAAAKPH